MIELEWEEYSPNQWAAHVIDKDIDIVYFEGTGEYDVVVDLKCKYTTRSKELAFEFANGWAEGYSARKIHG